MLRYVVLLVSSLVVLVQACDDHAECPVDFVLQDDGDLFVEYHAPEDDHYDKVIFKLFLTADQKLKLVDSNPEDHEGHEDWSVVFSKSTDFVACESYRIKVKSKTNGESNVERDLTKQIPGTNCAQVN